MVFFVVCTCFSTEKIDSSKFRIRHFCDVHENVSHPLQYNESVHDGGKNHQKLHCYRYHKNEHQCQCNNFYTFCHSNYSSVMPF